MSKDSKHIVIIEDEPWNELWLKESLEDHGYCVEMHPNVDSAWEQIQSKDQIDLIILDIIMPPGLLLGGQNVSPTEIGKRFYEYIIQARPQVRVINYTILPRDKTVQTIPYLAKNTEPTKIVEQIIKWLNDEKEPTKE